jgi:hypothetical protein
VNLNSRKASSLRPILPLTLGAHPGLLGRAYDQSSKMLKDRPSWNICPIWLNENQDFVGGNALAEANRAADSQGITPTIYPEDQADRSVKRVGILHLDDGRPVES